jgi:S1-C subfamily serine protease
MFALPFALALGALLHDRVLHPGRQRGVRAPAARVSVAASLDRGFVSDVYDSCSPSVALVVPRGVRNTTAQGSGFVISVDGDRYVLTSAHVAPGGMTMEVALAADGFAVRHNASVVGRAPGEDLAVLALDDDVVAAGLTPLEFGDSGALRPGCFVIALGHPSGIRGAVTLGVLAGRVELPAFDSAAAAGSARDGDGGDDAAAARRSATVPFLVTDAAFAGGMSGGPLCGEDGRVYGVNALVDGRLRGLGNLAVGGDRARLVAEAIVARRKAETRSACREIRVVLYNDRFNTRARVLGSLREAGLGEEEANAAMMGAHTRGRGVVRIFLTGAADVAGDGLGAGAALTDEAVEAAERLRADLAAADLLVELERVY